MTVKPQPAEMHNALTYNFDQLQPDSAVVDWVPIVVEDMRIRAQQDREKNPAAKNF